jgi:hypothetical protein
MISSVHSTNFSPAVRGLKRSSSAEASIRLNARRRFRPGYSAEFFFGRPRRPLTPASRAISRTFSRVNRASCARTAFTISSMPTKGFVSFSENERAHVGVGEAGRLAGGGGRPIHRRRPLDHDFAKANALRRVAAFRIFVGVSTRPEPIAASVGNGDQITQSIAIDHEKTARPAHKMRMVAQSLACRAQKLDLALCGGVQNGDAGAQMSGVLLEFGQSDCRSRGPERQHIDDIGEWQIFGVWKAPDPRSGKSLRRPPWPRLCRIPRQTCAPAGPDADRIGDRNRNIHAREFVDVECASRAVIFAAERLLESRRGAALGLPRKALSASPRLIA